MKRYTIESDFIDKNFSQTKLTLLFDKVKADTSAMIRPYFKLKGVNSQGQEVVLTTKYGNWWIIGKNYDKKYFTFNLSQDQVINGTRFSIGLIIDDVSNDNRVYFNHLQLAEGTATTYHQPESTIPKTDIKFTNNFYTNLYTSNTDGYLQVIRPYYNSMDTETITKSKTTVLAPHLKNEDSIDSPSNLGLEFMNASDQRIEILR